MFIPDECKPEIFFFFLTIFDKKKEGFSLAVRDSGPQNLSVGNPGLSYVVSFRPRVGENIDLHASSVAESSASLITIFLLH